MFPVGKDGKPILNFQSPVIIYPVFYNKQLYVLSTCFVWIREQMAIISLYSINWLGNIYVHRAEACLNIFTVSY
jgi:hypothetical protein